MTTAPIKVFLVDDSPISLAVQRRMLSNSDDIKIVGTALNGVTALKIIPRLKPNVVCTDYYMPQMDGIEFVQQVMKKYPCPILVVSCAVQEQDRDDVVSRFYAAGAVDVFAKPDGNEFNMRSNSNRMAETYVQKVRNASEHKLSTKSKIKVLLVDDSPVSLFVQKKMLARVDDIEVVGAARNGEEALNMIPQLKPNVICTDFHMYPVDGLELTQKIMKKHPCPILVVSTSVQDGDDDNVFRLLEAGAVDVFPKPCGKEFNLLSKLDDIGHQFVEKIRITAGMNLNQNRKQNVIRINTQRSCQWTRFNDFRAVVIGAATGGPQALKTILTTLPEDFPMPIVCIQHLSDEFLQHLIQWLSHYCKLRVKTAVVGEVPEAGTIYFPTPMSHLELDEKGRFTCSRQHSYKGYRPSISVSFNSMTEYYESRLMAILLTGMGSDGVDGMRTIANKGGLTIAQDEQSSLVFGMAHQAIEIGAVQHVLSLMEIQSMLKNQELPH